MTHVSRNPQEESCEEEDILFRKLELSDDNAQLIDGISAKECEELLREIVQLGEMYKDVQQLVEVQDVPIRHILDHIETVKEDVVEAEQEIKLAAGWAKSARSYSIYAVGGATTLCVASPLGALFGAKVALLAIGGLGGATIVLERLGSLIY
jgi:hypothetical protein